MLTDITKSMITLQDFEEYMSGVTYSESLPNEDQWNYNVTTRVARLKKSYGTRGAFRIPLNNLYAGDVIEVYCEYRVINGPLLKVSIDENGVASPPYTLSDSDEWQSAKIKYTVKNDIPYNSVNSRINIGYFSGDVGEYELKNVLVKINTVKSKNIPTIRKFHIVKKTTGWEIDKSFASDGGKVEESSASRLKLTYDKPFSGKKPIAIVSGGSSYGDSEKFRPTTLGSFNESVVIELIKKDGSIMWLSEAAEGAYFTLIVVGD